MTDHSSRLAAGGRRDVGALLLAQAQAGCAVAADAVLAALIVVSGILVWAPRIGIAAARETVVRRREARARLAEIGRSQSAVWARQMRRNTLARGHDCAPCRRAPLDP